MRVVTCKVRQIRLANGQESISLLNGARYEIAAATRDAPRGKTADFLYIDELREWTEEAFTAALPVTRARPNSMTLMTSNAGDGFIKFNLDALLRGTTLERYDAYTKGLREGFLSLNDVRSVEDLSPIGEAGDQFRVPLQNIDASDAKDVGLNLRADIVSKLVQVGFDPEEVLKAVEMVPIALELVNLGM